MSSKSFSSSDDGMKTPNTVTESKDIIQLNKKESEGPTPQTKLMVVPVLEDPSIFVWCLRCAVLVRIDYPAGHRLDSICSCKPGNSLFIGTVCLNCVELQEKSNRSNISGVTVRSEIIGSNAEVYISMKCIPQCSAFKKASSLTQISCIRVYEKMYGSEMLYYASIKRMLNLCDEKAKMRMVVVDQDREENYENFMVAGFM
ncbi:hypothetical protein GcM3_031023 [Golovinomyces cichoracearum]|uniref:Uncharacterized protein n=1 Tax=Golovinomyces cichoracearum TaxID=62708 RepID=A0A420J4Q8_9PEZI|nr:hypothetical protein GcM3_031023 [Golovinomyces cichoracearum]